jgi:hypothetical protein
MKSDAYTKTETLLASTCMVDNLSVSYSMLALLFPSVLSRLEVYLVADLLRTTVLKPVAFDTQHLPILITAVTPSGIDGGNNYQRLEVSSGESNASETYTDFNSSSSETASSSSLFRSISWLPIYAFRKAT